MPVVFLFLFCCDDFSTFPIAISFRVCMWCSDIEHFFSFLLQKSVLLFHREMRRKIAQKKYFSRLSSSLLASRCVSVRRNTLLTYFSVSWASFVVCVFMAQNDDYFGSILLLSFSSSSSLSRTQTRLSTQDFRLSFTLFRYSFIYNTERTKKYLEEKKVFICECTQKKMGKYLLYAKRYLNSRCLFRARPVGLC